MKLHELAQETLDQVSQGLLPPIPEGDPTSTAPLCRAAVIGFAGSDVRGTLGIGTSEAGLARVLAHSGATAECEPCEQRLAEDALAELSNMLLGAVKRAWLRRGVHITLATPLVIRGLSIEVLGGENNSWFSSEFSAGDDRVTAWIDIHCNDDLEIPTEDQEIDQVVEGEALLF